MTLFLFSVDKSQPGLVIRIVHPVAYFIKERKSIEKYFELCKCRCFTDFSGICYKPFFARS